MIIAQEKTFFSNDVYLFNIDDSSAHKRNVLFATDNDKAMICRLSKLLLIFTNHAELY